MNIDKLVPPLKLCKLIPKGEFEDSVFVWGYSCDKRNTEPFVDERDCLEFCRKKMVNAPDTYPAPTLEEIMAELPATTVCGKEHHSDWYVSHWQIGCVEDTERKGAATAALKVWLKQSDQSNKQKDQSK